MRTLLAACVSVSALVAALVAPDGCSSSSSGTCAPEGTVTVTVTDTAVDSNTNFVCNATVTIAATGGAPRTLTPQGGVDGSNANCVYVTNVAPGSYTLTANAPTFATGTELITIQQVGCVTASPTEVIPLIPTQAGTDDGGTDDDADVIRDATTNPG
jgi:hypothetical protein